jgi:Co/Zn/Cd efflux system component
VSKRSWRIFVLVNGIGVFLFTFGTIDGSPLTAAFLPVGILLLFPGTFVAFEVGPYLGHIVANDAAAMFLASLLAVLVNGMIWMLIAGVNQGVRNRRPEK